MDWNFNGSVENERVLRPLCERVSAYFPLVGANNYCYFALPNHGVDDEYLSKKIGTYFRGVHIPGSGTDEVSRHLQDRCLPPGARKRNRYDNLIFIRHNTCLDPTGCVLTYAHELQHIMQESQFPRLMAANRVLRANLRVFEPGATEIDLPCEADANIVSKRVAEEICGVEPVRKYAQEQLRHMTLADVVDHQIRWRFFLKSPPYDWVTETLSLTKKYAGHMPFKMEVSKEDWWKEP
jgi:hypothetical protein